MRGERTEKNVGVKRIRDRPRISMRGVQRGEVVVDRERMSEDGRWRERERERKKERRTGQKNS